jgi:hypothetical protein
VATALAIAMTVAALIVAVVENLPFRDPDSLVGPTYVRLPIILALGYLTDVLPRAVSRASRAGSLAGIGHQIVVVTRERWPREHIRFALLGLGSWYLTYVSFRNLKSYVPYVNHDLFDDAFAAIDRTMFFGNDPATLLQNVLGTGWAAHLMSFIYIAWIAVVPGTLAAALVWSRNVSGGSWLVTAVAVDWALGAATYLAFPTVGPIYAQPDLFAKLAHTPVTNLQTTMIAERAEVLSDPWATEAVQTIAAFASLHVGITVTICVIASLLRLDIWVRTVLWSFLFLTVVSTVYLGWHYVADAFGGVVLGVAGVWLAALATGNHLRGRPMYRQREDPRETVLI